ncbi:hypothetical protein LCGC14_0782150 [marine sediment metagenome]|uniref:Polyprenyl synthetase n=1 Tax=marine sediment metagenome TaxID=412755 RepID=A0A0F9PVF8_9ZZZZ
MVLTYEKWETRVKEVEQEIRDVLKGGGTPLNIACSYQMGLCTKDGVEADLTKGKFLRPTLLMLMCTGLGGKSETALSAAACLELIHRSSLVFDDIQDNGLDRNGRPTIPAVWGSNQAINAGNALSCYARLALQRMRGKGCPESVVLDVMDVLERMVIRICEGQWQDLAFQKGEIGIHKPISFYMDMARNKTGALFAAACEVGAMIAGSPPSVQYAAHRFGEFLGLAFQIHDDYLGIWGDETEVGKTANDLMEKKHSLPVAIALERIPNEHVMPMKCMVHVLNSPFISPQDAVVIRETMEANGIDKQTLSMERQIASDAEKALRTIPVNTAELEGLLNFIKAGMERTF